MSVYVLRRLLTAVPTVLGAATIIFLIIHLIPGDPVLVILQEHFSRESYDAVKGRLGLDRPLYARYLAFLGNAARGNLGQSFRTKRPVAENIADMFPFTAQLAVAGFLVSLAIGLPMGAVAALHRGRLADVAAMGGALLGVCTPSFWLGVLLILLFSVHLAWLPASGAGEFNDPASLLRHLILPAVTVGLQGAALQARITRSAVLEALGQDYVRTARAKGLSPGVVLRRHALRNALIPVVTVAGMDMARLLGGTTVVEIVFSRPGIGKILVDAITTRDYPQIQGILMVYITLIVAINIVVDLLYAAVDPRVTYA
ncbi:MAG: ABC transporter permease [Armatimonadetes bacterium]|nr:ABC transporter permease [Armatimonadota bacterium]